MKYLISQTPHELTHVFSGHVLWRGEIQLNYITRSLASSYERNVIAVASAEAAHKPQQNCMLVGLNLHQRCALTHRVQVSL